MLKNVLNLCEAVLKYFGCSSVGEKCHYCEEIFETLEIQKGITFKLARRNSKHAQKPMKSYILW